MHSAVVLTASACVETDYTHCPSVQPLDSEIVRDCFVSSHLCKVGLFVFNFTLYCLAIWIIFKVKDITVRERLRNRKTSLRCPFASFR